MVADLNETTSPECMAASVIEELARNASKIALHHFRSIASLPVEKKGHLDLVTQADREVEEFLILHLHKMFPDDGIYGEEGGDIAGTSGRIWVLDPIDGTFNFVRGSHNWAISIGLYENRRPVFGVIYAPVYDMMLTGGKLVETRMNGKLMPPPPPLNLSQASMGIGMSPYVSTPDRLEVLRYISDDLRISFRCCGASTLSLIEVATGQTDGYLAMGDATWDVMAGLPILANLGISHTIDWDHTDLNMKLRFACGSEEFLTRVRPLLDCVGGTAAAK